MKNSLSLAICILALLSACSINDSSRDESHLDEEILIYFSLKTQELRAFDAEITSIVSLDDQGQETPISDKPNIVTWHPGDRAQLLTSNRINLDEIVAIKVSFKLNRQSIQLASRSPDVYVQAIDSVNRVIPDQAEDFSVTIVLSEQQKRAIGSSQSIHIEMDGDKSIQTLYGEKKDNGSEQMVTLFKPYLQLSSKPDAWFYWAQCVELSASKLVIAVPWQAQKLVKKAVSISAFSVDYKEKPFSEILNIKESLIDKKIKLYEDNVATTVEFFTKRPKVTFVSAQVIQSANGVSLKGKHLGDEEFFGVAGDPQKNPKATIYSPEGDPLDVPLESLISGQQVKGVINADASEYYLLQGKLLAMIVKTSPLVVQPLTYNGVAINTLAPLVLEANTSEELFVGDVVNVTGFGTQEKFFSHSIKRVVEERLTYRILLPQSLSESLITEIQEQRLFVLNEKTQNHSKESLTIENTALSLALDVDFIEATDASVTVYIDRLIDSNRYETFSDFSSALPVILFQLKSMHHINEIHATGFLKGSIFIAEKIELVFYGFSTFDFMSTQRQLDQLATEGLEENNLIHENGNQKTYLIGAGLAAGLALSASGLLVAKHLFNKNKQSQPYLLDPSTLSVGSSIPLSTNEAGNVDPNDGVNDRETEFKEVDINFGKEKYAAKILSIKKPEVVYEPGEEIYQMPRDLNYQEFDKVVVSKVNNELYIDSYKDGKITSRAPAVKVDPNLYGVSYISRNEEVTNPNKGVSLENFYLRKYPDKFVRDRFMLKFKGIEVQELFAKDRYIGFDLAIDYISAYAKMNDKLFYFQTRHDAIYQKNTNITGDDTAISKINNVISIDDNIIKQFDAKTISGGDAIGLRQNLINYTVEFIKSNKKYAILPVIPGGHFGSLVLIKDEASGIIKPFYIEPRDIKSLEKDSAAKLMPGLLPTDTELKKVLGDKKKIQYNLKETIEFLSTGIQIDGNSCGPIAMVTAADLVDKVEQRGLNFDEITGKKLIGYINDFRKTPQYTQEKGHANFRERMLLMLDTAKVFNETAYDYNRRVRRP